MSGDVNACKAKCNSLSNCKGFSFQNGKNKCWMKTTNITDSPSLGTSSNVYCGGKKSGWPLGTFDFYDKEVPAPPEVSPPAVSPPAVSPPAGSPQAAPGVPTLDQTASEEPLYNITGMEVSQSHALMATAGMVALISVALI
jgi:hypothetical protein